MPAEQRKSVLFFFSRDVRNHSEVSGVDGDSRPFQALLSQRPVTFGPLDSRDPEKEEDPAHLFCLLVVFDHNGQVLLQGPDDVRGTLVGFAKQWHDEVAHEQLGNLEDTQQRSCL